VTATWYFMADDRSAVRFSLRRALVSQIEQVYL
jgi:hypothetical protein